MKSVLISIRPQWCELIAAGKKTIEVRKTRPRLETPFKCYIYCTKGSPYLNRRNGIFYLESKDILGGHGPGLYKRLSGHVIGEFVCDKVFLWNHDIHDEDTITLEAAREQSCLSEDSLLKYADGYFYGWHISNLIIYDKPKQLRSFYKECAGLDNTGLCYECENAFGEECDCTVNGCLRFTRPPQSWCYVEEM